MYQTREEWLNAAVTALRPRFEGLDVTPTEKIAAIVSWPKGSKTAIGQCFADSWTKEGVTYITVSPVLGEDPARVLDVVLHEMIHAGGIHNHGKDFKRAALALGLTGKMRATVATPELTEELKVLAEELGAYPHHVMADQKATKKAATGKNNQRKLVSPEDPNYIVYMLPGKLEEYGPPLCPMSGKPLETAN